MTVNEAIEQLIQSDRFKDIAKQKNAIGGKYRMFLTRYHNGELKNGAAFDMLLEHGFKVDIKKPSKAVI